MALLLLGILSFSFFSCTNYLAEAQDYKNANFNPNTSISDDSLRLIMREKGLKLEYTLEYRDDKSSGALQTLRVQAFYDHDLPVNELTLFSRRDQDSWQERGQLNNENEWEIELNSPSALSDTNSVDFQNIYALGVKKGDSLGVSLIEWPFTSAYAQALHLITVDAGPGISLWTQSLVDAASKNITGASQHLGLASAGNHTLHLKHVHQFINGQRGSDPQYRKEAPPPSIDTLGAASQIDLLRTQLTQMERSSNWNDSQIQLYEEIDESLDQLYDLLVEISEQIPNWLEESLATNQNVFDQKQLDLDFQLDKTLYNLNDFTLHIEPLFKHHLIP